MASNEIKIFGAREHNLKSVDVKIPKNCLTVITGPSGSGKSSLALDTLFAEGKRRYVESLSSYARQFLGLSKKPDVDRIEGLCPAIAIEQKNSGFNPRSTVGTTTEIYDYLRVLFARLGTPHCSGCNSIIKPESAQGLSDMTLERTNGQELTIAAQLALDKKGEFKLLFGDLFIKGYCNFLIDGLKVTFKSLDEVDNFDIERSSKHRVYLILDHFIVSQEEADRLLSAVQKAFEISKGLCSFIDKKNEITTYSSSKICLACAKSLPELEPRLFSFNSPIGACKKCNGLGVEYKWHWMSTAGEDDSSELTKECSDCNGSRLNKNALFVKVTEKNIFELVRMSIRELSAFFKK
jgi:excinuclease ABC subunit A